MVGVPDCKLSGEAGGSDEGLQGSLEAIDGSAPSFGGFDEEDELLSEGL